MKIEQEIMEMFDERFNINIAWGIDNSAGEYGLTAQGWEEIKSFISHIITLVQKRKKEEMVEKTLRIDRYYSNPKGKPMIYVEELNKIIQND